MVEDEGRKVRRHRDLPAEKSTSKDYISLTMPIPKHFHRFPKTEKTLRNRLGRPTTPLRAFGQGFTHLGQTDSLTDPQISIRSNDSPSHEITLLPAN